MKLLILEVLSEIAYFKNQSQLPKNYLHIQQLISSIQILALLFPRNGWNLWNYSIDPVFNYFQTFINCFLILPISLNKKIISQVIVSIFFIFQCGILLCLAILIFVKQIFKNQEIQKGFLFFLFKTINSYFLHINYFIGNLFLIFYGSSIFCQKFQQYENNICTQNSIFFIALAGILLTVISQFISVYFFRSFTFKPNSILQAKYSLNQIIHICLRLGLFTLYFQDYNSFNNYIFFILINCQTLLQFFDIYYQNSFYPPSNELILQFHSCVLSISILITLNVLSENTLLNQYQIFISSLLVGCFAFQAPKILFERKMFHKPHQLMQTQSKTIDVVQRLFVYNQDLKSQIRQSCFYYYYSLIQNHILKEQVDITFKNLSSRKCIIQLLQQQLKACKQNGRVNYEDIQLIYINFLSHYCKKPLLALVEFRKYEIFNQIQQSFFFSFINGEINQNLEEIIKNQQKSNGKMIQSKEQDKQSLDIIHISKSLIFEEIYIPNIIKLMDSKIQFWELLIKGYKDIYEFQKQAVILSKKVQQLQNQLLQNLSFDLENINHLGTNCNVLELKIASIFQSSVMNDYYNSAQCEYLIQEIFNIEHTLQSDVITNFSLVEDKVAFIMLSLVKNLGQIINVDKRGLSQYFGYDEKEFQQIQSINQLMPPFLSVIHDNLLENYLQQAKSKLFISYNMVFSSDRQGYLIPQQLKIDNNFLIQDDYVLMGCLSQIKQGIDYILFSDDGKILGVTQAFFETYIQGQNDKISLQKLLNLCYIYMFIPQIIKIIDSYKKQFLEQNEENFIVEDTSLFIMRQNILEIITQFQRSSFTTPLKSFNQSISKGQNVQLSEGSLSKKIGTISLQFKEQNQDDQDNFAGVPNYSKQDMNLEQYDGIPLLSKQHQMEITSYLENIEDKQSEQYIIKFMLNLKKIGKDEYKRQFFILEIFDIRKKDVIGKSNSSMPLQFLDESKLYSMKNNNFNSAQEEQTNQTVSGFTQTEQPFSEIVPVQKDIGCGVTELLERLGHSKRNKQDQDFGLFNLESARDSISYGPLSQRAHFINPNQKEGEFEEMGKIDQDFNNINQQLNSASAILQQKNNELIDEFDIDDSIKQQQQNQLGKSSSEQEKGKRQDIIHIIKTNKLKGKNHEEEDVEALKSKSSMTSGTSGNSAIQIIKKFQSTTHLTQGLKFVTFTSLSVFLILIIFITVHLVIITISNQDTQLTINDINGPFILNRSYLEVISFSWSLIVGALEILHTSDFIQSQTYSDLYNTTSTLYDEISQMYLGFVEVEERGLLQLQQFHFLNGQTETTTFPYFISLIEGTLDRVVKIVSVEREEIKTFLNKEYMDQLFILRYNLNQLYLMSSELIDSLNIIFLNQTNQKVQEMQIQVIIEIVCLAVILCIELYFWKQIQNYCQQLMLLTGRIQESDANELIARATIVKETLQQQSGKFSWKKQNYYNLNYQPLNTLNIELFNSQSKVLKDLTMNHFNINHNKTIQQQLNEQRNPQKRNLNVVLSSRIYNTQISIISYIIMLIIIFIILAILLFGGYLLFSQQIIDLGPSQQLTGNYIKFTQKLDTLMACALILKTQHLIYDEVVTKNIYDNQTINKFQETNDIVELFSELSKIYSENLTNIYESILSSNKIKDIDKQKLYTLYQDDFCIELSDEIPMCNFDEFGLDKFTEAFGQPQLPIDDNTEFVNKGIVGVISRLDTLFNQIFDYEIEYKQFQPDLDLCLKQINLKEYRNAVFAHFLDTNDGTNTFLDIIYTSIYGILDENLNYIYLYYGVLGVIIGLSYAIFYIIMIINTNNKLIRTRLALITLPINILTEQHTISMLKRLN